MCTVMEMHFCMKGLSILPGFATTTHLNNNYAYISSPSDMFLSSPTPCLHLDFICNLLFCFQFRWRNFRCKTTYAQPISLSELIRVPVSNSWLMGEAGSLRIGI